MGEIVCDDEIRLDAGWVDFISSAKQISSEQSEDFIALCAISLKNEQSCSIIQLDKLEFDGQFDKNIVGATISRPRAADCRPYNTG